MANITKFVLAKTLKELMKTKAFGEISIKDITDECDLNRQTFYYHFTDKQKLINWIFDREVIDKVEADFTYDRWDKALEMTFRLVKQDSAFYLNALQDNFSFFYIHLLQTQRGIMNSIIEELLDGRRMERNDKDFFADFYTNAFVGTFINWINSSMQEPHERVIARLKKIISGSLRNSISDYIK